MKPSKAFIVVIGIACLVILTLCLHLILGYSNIEKVLEYKLGCAVPSNVSIVQYRYIFGSIETLLESESEETYDDFLESISAVDGYIQRELTVAAANNLTFEILQNVEVKKGTYFYTMLYPYDVWGIICKCEDKTVIYIESPTSRNLEGVYGYINESYDGYIYRTESDEGIETIP